MAFGSDVTMIDGLCEHATFTTLVSIGPTDAETRTRRSPARIAAMASSAGTPGTLFMRRARLA